MKKSKEVVEMRIVDMRLVLKFYVPMLIMLIPAMFLIHAPALKEGKFLAVLGLYALFSFVLFANLVFLQIVYLVKSREIMAATTFLNLILYQYPLFCMVITQTGDLLIITFILISISLSVFKMLDRLL
jgi:hypothetical protein